MRIEVSVPGITKELGKLSPRGAEARTTASQANRRFAVSSTVPRCASRSKLARLSPPRT